MGMLLTYFGLMQVALFFAKEKPVVRSELGRYDLGAFVVAKFLREIPITFWCPCVFLATLYWAQGTRDVGRFCAELAVVASLNWAVGAVGFVFACSDIHEADMRQITLQFATFFTLVSGVYCCLTSMPAWTRELAALSPTKWAIEALVTLEFPRPDQRYVLDTAGYERLPAARAVGILLLMAARAGARAAGARGERLLLVSVPDGARDAPPLGVASLRAPSRSGARKATSRVLRELNLTSVGASLVGDGTRVRGVSGGERKRVAVGKYLFQRDLKVLLVDEPTTGLDAAQALVVVATLRTLASEGGCAVYATLHQPRSSIFALLDGLHLLAEGASSRARGRAVDYFGTHLGATCGERDSPTDFFLDALTLDGSSDAATAREAARGLRRNLGARARRDGPEALVEQERGMYATAALAATRLLVGNAKVCIQPTLLLVVAYVGTGAGRDPAAFGRILAFYLGAVSACYAFGLATLCIPGVENQARDFWTNQSLFFCILPAGYFINIHTIPRSMKWLALVSPSGR
ncbi:ABC transporter G family member [Aureococcus anophagefferens]|nr:ABC transporter G family member [Aureococcus anophagefferens]